MARQSITAAARVTSVTGTYAHRSLERKAGAPGNGFRPALLIASVTAPIQRPATASQSMTDFGKCLSQRDRNPSYHGHLGS